MKNRPRRVVITPIYNESRVLADILALIEKEADLVIAVDDCSTDDTPRILSQWRDGNDRAIVIRSKKNGGASVALRKGYALVDHFHATGALEGDDLVVEIDSDGQHDPKYIRELCDLFESYGGKIDVVLGRRDFSVYPLYKVLGNKGLTIAASILGGFLYKDVESNFRAMRVSSFRELLKWYGGYKYSGAFEVGIILAHLGYRTDNNHIIEVPTYRHGAGFMDGFHVLSMGIIARWRLLIRREIPDNQSFREQMLAELTAPPWYPGGKAPAPK
ncbi:MAG: glycosyltransferase family 2 protein [Candidatus Eisenbacteria bacterium]|nr:glycosyltransferase family 2 protein [Candidatus Eisenbacteria bacterium]